MSAYNSQDYIKESIVSVLTQTFEDFEFIIINDGSTDSTEKIIKDFMIKDNRIKLISHDNIGLTKSLNIGLENATGDYIARQDADDISLSRRFEKQVDFLDKNSKIGLCATSWWLSADDALPIFSYDYSDLLLNLKDTLSNGNNIIMHSSVMFRRKVIKNLSPVYQHKYAQDYDLWLRLINKTQLKVIDENLCIRRVSNSSISQDKSIANERNEIIQKIYKSHINASESSEKFSKSQKSNLFRKIKNNNFDSRHFLQYSLFLLAKKPSKARHSLQEINKSFFNYFLYSLTHLPLICDFSRIIFQTFFVKRKVVWYG